MPPRCRPPRSPWSCRSTASCAATSPWPRAPTRLRCAPRRSPSRTRRSSSARPQCEKSSSCRVSSSTSWCNRAMPLVKAGRRIAGLSLLLALCACGFRLAGSDPLPKVLARPYLSLKDPYTDFSREFEHQLKTSGAALQPNADGATATIEVSRDLVQQRTLSVSATNIPTEYELTYTVIVAVRAGDK